MKYFYLFLSFFLTIKGVSQVENQKYKILSKADEIEIREYSSAIYASVTLDNSKKQQNSSFRILAGYIFGENDKNQKIAMTAPVHIYEKNNQGKQLMTMKFVMPGEYEMKDLSKPNDSRVEIKKSGEKKYAAISFNGYNNDYKFNLYSKKLKEYLDSENILYINTPIFLGYDPPYKFWKRKNEVLFEISN